MGLEKISSAAKKVATTIKSVALKAGDLVSSAKKAALSKVGCVLNEVTKLEDKKKENVAGLNKKHEAELAELNKKHEAELAELKSEQEKFWAGVKKRQEVEEAELKKMQTESLKLKESAHQFFNDPQNTAQNAIKEEDKYIVLVNKAKNLCKYNKDETLKVMKEVLDERKRIGKKINIDNFNEEFKKLMGSVKEKYDAWFWGSGSEDSQNERKLDECLDKAINFLDKNEKYLLTNNWDDDFIQSFLDHPERILR